MAKRFGNFLWGLVLIIVGALILFDNLEILEFWEALNKIWPILLIILGLWIIYKKFGSTATIVGMPPKQKNMNQGFGDLIVDAKDIDPDGLNLSSGFGDVEVNLTRARFEDKEHVVNVNSGFGDLRVMLPKYIPASAFGKSFAGKIDILGRTADGLGNSLEYKDENYDSSTRKVKINAKLGFGDIRIFRV
jgi:predicted membrane protein